MNLSIPGSGAWAPTPPRRRPDAKGHNRVSAWSRKGKRYNRRRTWEEEGGVLINQTTVQKPNTLAHLIPDSQGLALHTTSLSVVIWPTFLTLVQTIFYRCSELIMLKLLLVSECEEAIYW